MREIVKIYPRTNNSSFLEFSIPGNPRGHLDLNNVLLHFNIEIPTTSTSPYGSDGKKPAVQPQNYLGPKQFSTVDVKINGRTVAGRSCQNEYFLSSYFQHIINYGATYIKTGCRTIGVFDHQNFLTKELKSMSDAQKSHVNLTRSNILHYSGKFEIVMPIDSSIFYSNNFLPTKTPIDLSFERLKSRFSTIMVEDANKGEMVDSVLELKDCYLEVPFVKDDETFDSERGLINKPIKISYDDFSIRKHNILAGTNSVSLTNVMTGKLPTLLLWGLQSKNSYNGSFEHSSTRFNKFGINKVTLFINGSVVNGFPIYSPSGFASSPYNKFLQNTNQQMNSNVGDCLMIRDYAQYNFILSARLNKNEYGSLSFQFDFDEDIAEDLVLVTCAINEEQLKIDQYRNFEISNNNSY